MNKLLAALSWSGRDTILSLFVAFPRDRSAHLVAPSGTSQPGAVRIYDLEDPDDGIPNLSFVEYDLTYNDPPPDLELVVQEWLHAAMSAGAWLAWFAFEGSFDFEHLLTPDVANQIYAVSTPDGEALALEDEQREGADWVASLEAARRNSGL